NPRRHRGRAMSGLPEVMTVTGPIPATELGITLPHEHLLIDLTRQIIIGGRINDLELLTQELNAFTAVGGRTLVDCTTDTIGRDRRTAARAQERTELSITTHTARWPNVLKQLAILPAEGLDPRRVIIGHCDTVPSMDYHTAIAKQGA